MSFQTAGGAVLEDGDGTDLAQVYNPKTHLWTEVAPMQIARSGSAACTLKGKIYVIGKKGKGCFSLRLTVTLSYIPDRKCICIDLFLLPRWLACLH